MFAADDLERAAAILRTCRQCGFTLATAESCTGGLVAALLTEVAGSSAVVDRGFVTYSNQAKIDLLDVPAGVLETHGAVSAETAGAMARGALGRSRATHAISITGIAGPGGGSAAKPVGLVHFGLAVRDGPVTLSEQHFGDLGRGAVRRAALRHALATIEGAIAQAAP